MTKFKFYTIKALIIISMFGFVYLMKLFIQKYDFEYKLIFAIVIGCIFTFLVKFLITYKRPELPQEREERKAIEKRIDEMFLEEITLSTNEKIRGTFLDEGKYLEDVETENRYYKTSIVKIEKVSGGN